MLLGQGRKRDTERKTRKANARLLIALSTSATLTRSFPQMSIQHYYRVRYDIALDILLDQIRRQCFMLPFVCLSISCRNRYSISFGSHVGIQSMMSGE